MLQEILNIWKIFNENNVRYLTIGVSSKYLWLYSKYM
ncbi:hypothetical protein J2W48_003115 [Flavobacterium piscis]|uniref:Uncharacterized protein n=1 Tax=Flavobacterium piscis TaxID=1114874 RepID=A0ABU1YAD9_9FLAO|nr:hypothetical protein [Flavobacterium piscis]